MALPPFARYLLDVEAQRRRPVVNPMAFSPPSSPLPVYGPPAPPPPLPPRQTYAGPVPTGADLALLALLVGEGQRSPIPRPAQGSAPMPSLLGVPLPTQGPLYPNIIPEGGPQIYPEEIQNILAQLGRGPSPNPLVGGVPPPGMPEPQPGPPPIPARETGGPPGEAWSILDPILRALVQAPGAVATGIGAVGEPATSAIGYVGDVITGERRLGEDIETTQGALGEAARATSGETQLLLGGESDLPGAIAEGTARGLTYLDEPRQVRVDVAGDAANEIWSGGEPSLVEGLAFFDPPFIFQGGSEDGGAESFTVFVLTADEERKAEGRRIYEEGYDANGDGVIDFTGGRAVWEWYVGQQPRWFRVWLDIWYDPLNVPMAAAPVGRVAIKLGEEAPGVLGLLARTVGRGLVATDVATSPLELPRGILRLAGGGRFIGPTPMEEAADVVARAVADAVDPAATGLVGPGGIRGFTQASARTRAEQATRRMTEMAQREAMQASALRLGVEPEGVLVGAPTRPAPVVTVAEPAPVIEPDMTRVVATSETGPIIEPAPRETVAVVEPPKPLPIRQTAAGRSVIGFEGNPPVRVEVRPVGGAPRYVVQVEDAAGRWADDGPLTTRWAAIADAQGRIVPEVPAPPIGEAPTIGRITPQRKYGVEDNAGEVHVFDTEEEARIFAGGERVAPEPPPVADEAVAAGARVAPAPTGTVRLYRGEQVPGTGVPAPAWVRQGLQRTGATDAEGRWFTSDPAIAKWYLDEAGGNGRIVYVDVPADLAERSRVRNIPDAARFSRDPDNEFFLPREIASARQPIADPAAPPDFSSLPPYLRVDTRPMVETPAHNQQRRVWRTTKGGAFHDREGKPLPLAQHVEDVVRPVRPELADEFHRGYADIARWQRDEIEPWIRATGGEGSTPAEVLGNAEFYARLIGLYQATIGDAVSLPRHRWQTAAAPQWADAAKTALKGSDAYLVEHVLWGRTGPGHTADAALRTLAGRAATKPALVPAVRKAIAMRAAFREELADVLPQLFDKRNPLDPPSDVPPVFRADSATGGVAFEADLIHGSSVEGLTSISADPPQRSFTNGSSFLGAFFTPSPWDAEYFAGSGAAKYTARVRLQRPYVMTQDQLDRLNPPEMADEARALRRRLESEGYDGIVTREADGSVGEVASFRDVPVSGRLPDAPARAGDPRPTIPAPPLAEAAPDVGGATYATLPGLPQLSHYLTRVQAQRQQARLAERAVADQVQRAAATPLPGGVTRAIPRSAQDEALRNTPFTTPERAGQTYAQVWEGYTAEIVEGRRLLARQQGAGPRPAGLPGIGPQFGAGLSKAEQKRLTTLVNRWEGTPKAKGQPAKPGELAGGALTETEDPGILAAQAMRRDFNLEAGYEDTRTKAGKVLDEAAQFYREKTLLAPWKFVQYMAANSTDAIRYVIAGHPEAALKGFDVRSARELYRYAKSGKASSLVNSPLAQFYRKAEVGLPFNRTHTTMQFGEGSSAFRRVFGKAKAGWVGTPVEWARNVENAAEYLRRGALHREVFGSGMIRAQKPFRAHVRDLAKRRNVAIPDAVLEQGIRDLGHVYGPVALEQRLERLALANGASTGQAAGFAERAAKDWRAVQNTLMDKAGKEVDRVAFSYEYTNADELIARIGPFHYWSTRALRFYTEEGLRHPGLMAAYYRALEGIEDHAEEYGVTGGFLKLWNTATGWTLFFHPMAALGLLDIFDGMGFTPDGETLIGKIARNIQQYTGIALYPWFAALFNYAGLFGESFVGLDPTGFYKERSIFQTIYNALGVVGAFGEDWDPKLAPPFEQALQNVRDKISGLLGIKHVPAGDAAWYPKREIDIRIEARYRTANGIAPDAPLTDAQMEELIAIQANPDDPIHRAAAEDWAEAGAIQAGLQAIIPGPFRRRQTDEPERRARVDEAYDLPPESTAITIEGLSRRLTDPYADQLITQEELDWLRQYEELTGKPYQPGDLANLRDQRILQSRLNNAPPETKPYLLQEFEYYHLGSEQQRRVLDATNEIAYGTPHFPVIVGGKTVTPAALMAMTGEQRRQLADQWLLETDPRGAVNQLRDLRTAYEETHPAVGRYLDWRRSKRAEWPNLTQYREELARVNPNARRFIEAEQAKLRKKYGSSLTPAILQEELDRAILSLEGFLAVQGMALRYGDPLPIAVSDPKAVVADPRGPNAKDGTGEEETFGGRLARAVPETEALIARVEAELAARYGGTVDYRTLPPPIRAFVESQYPELATDDVRIALEYLTWAEMQKAQGKDASQAGYLQQQGWKQVTATGPATAPNPLELMPQAAQRITPGSVGAGDFGAPGGSYRYEPGGFGNQYQERYVP